MKIRKTLSSWLAVKYILTIRNEENLESRKTIVYNHAKLILGISTIFLVVLVSCLYLSKTILAQWLDPRYQEIELKKQVVNLSFKVDSLNLEMARKNNFILNIKKIISGDKSLLKEDSLNYIQMTHSVSMKDLDQTNPVDQAFRKEMENETYSDLSKKQNITDQLQSLFFFTPLSGIVVSKFNPEIHRMGIDILSQDDESVKSIADGVVIFSSWAQEGEYVVIIQHLNDILSIYKHNATLLKKVGNFVKAGDIIAIAGSEMEGGVGSRIYFELWYGGNPVNPEDFITF